MATKQALLDLWLEFLMGLTEGELELLFEKLEKLCDQTGSRK